jgi:hypothetical protein
MKFKFILALVAMAGFSALPAFAQHGHGGGSASGGGGGHDSHASSSTSGHGGDHDGKDGDKGGDGHGGKHDGDHGGHGNIASKLASNPALSSKLSALLPPGTDLAKAAAGFHNLRDFAAAVHASKDLGIPFDQLKAKMTGPGAENLRKAIVDLAPTANAKAAEKQAEQEAKADLHTAGDHDGQKHDAANHEAHDAAGAHDADDKPKTP